MPAVLSKGTPSAGLPRGRELWTVDGQQPRQRVRGDVCPIGRSRSVPLRPVVTFLARRVSTRSAFSKLGATASSSGAFEAGPRSSQASPRQGPHPEAPPMCLLAKEAPGRRRFSSSVPRVPRERPRSQGPRSPPSQLVITHPGLLRRDRFDGIFGRRGPLPVGSEGELQAWLSPCSWASAPP